MKKKILMVFVACIMSTTAIFAFGIGIQGGTDVSLNDANSVDITFKLNTSPFIFAIGIPAIGDTVAFGGTADYWLVNDNVTGPINYFLGVGLFLNTAIYDNSSMGTIGGRIPIGLNMFVAKNVLELYVQIAPGYGYNIYSDGSSLADRTSYFCPLNAGLRVWF